MASYYSRATLEMRRQTSKRGWSQDGGVEGHRVRVSLQPGHLLGAGGGPRTPKRTGGFPTRPGRTLGGKEGGRKHGGRMGLVPLRGKRGRGGAPKLRGAHSWRGNQRGWGETFRGSGNQRGMRPASLLPHSDPRPETLPSGAHSGL